MISLENAGNKLFISLITATNEGDKDVVFC